MNNIENNNFETEIDYTEEDGPVISYVTEELEPVSVLLVITIVILPVIGSFFLWSIIFNKLF